MDGVEERDSGFNREQRSQRSKRICVRPVCRSRGGRARGGEGELQTRRGIKDPSPLRVRSSPSPLQPGPAGPAATASR